MQAPTDCTLQCSALTLFDDCEVEDDVPGACLEAMAPGESASPCGLGAKDVWETVGTDGCSGASSGEGPFTDRHDRLERPPHSREFCGYFERQVLARCGLHALNNAAGGPFFNADDMSVACTEYVSEAPREGFLEHRDAHELPTGWFSEAVLAYVVRWKIAYHTLGAFTSMSLDLDNPVRSDTFLLSASFMNIPWGWW